MELLFSYGTLQQEEVQLQTFGRRLSGLKTTIAGFKVGTLKIKDPEVVALSGKEVHPILQRTQDLQDQVSGMAFEVTEDELLLADRYEVPQYKRVLVKSTDDRAVWIYADRNDFPN